MLMEELTNEQKFHVFWKRNFSRKIEELAICKDELFAVSDENILILVKPNTSTILTK